MLIDKTDEWKGYGKENYFWIEYRLEGERIEKIRCHRFGFFDGKEHIWDRDDELVESWSTDDPNLPAWLKDFLNQFE